MKIAITNLRMRIEELLDNVDPYGLHISEDSRIYLKDEISGIVVKEVQKALEQQRKESTV